MPGGGCVPLIPYLISRSRGEALNPEHTHTHTLFCKHTYWPQRNTRAILRTKIYVVPRMIGKYCTVLSMAIQYIKDHFTYSSETNNHCCKDIIWGFASL